MGRLIEQQAVIDCLNNTAEYYERKDADEWTRGMRYGLLHGVDNILDNVPTVEAIPKADYEARLKADLVAMLTDMLIDVEEIASREQWCDYANDNCISRYDVEDLIQKKIKVLQGECRWSD